MEKVKLTGCLHYTFQKEREYQAERISSLQSQAAKSDSTKYWQWQYKFTARQKKTMLTHPNLLDGTDADIPPILEPDSKKCDHKKTN